jgi:hypothetical protein
MHTYNPLLNRGLQPPGSKQAHRHAQAHERGGGGGGGGAHPPSIPAVPSWPGFPASPGMPGCTAHEGVSTQEVLRGTHGGYSRCTHGVIQGLEGSGCAACTALSYALARVCSTTVEYHKSTTRVLDRQVSTHMKVRTWPGFPAKPSSPACPHGRLVLGGYSRGTHTGEHTWPGVPAKPSSPGLPARPRRPRAPSAPGRPWSPSAPFCPAHSRLAQPSPLTAAFPLTAVFPVTAALALPPGSHLRRHSHLRPTPTYGRIPTNGRIPAYSRIPSYGGTRTSTRFPLTAALRPIQGLPPLGSRGPHAVLGVLTLGNYQQRRAAGGGGGGGYSVFSPWVLPAEAESGGNQGGAAEAESGGNQGGGGGMVGTFRSGRYGAWVSPLNRGPSARG